MQTANGDTIDYSIDPLNRRVERKVNSLLTNKHLYLGQLNPFSELYPGDKIKSLFIYAEKSNVLLFIVGQCKLATKMEL